LWGVRGSATRHDLFGYALSPFAGTGLAVGAPNENVGPTPDAGQVTGLEALAGKLPGTGGRHSYYQGAPGVPGQSEAGDGFGAALAPRGSTALTIGAPGEDVLGYTGVDAGAIVDIPTPGSSVPATSWYQGKEGLVESRNRGDLFGHSLTELAGGSVAVGAPLEDDGGSDAGEVTVIHDGPDGALVADGSETIYQDDVRVPGVSELRDYFGYALSSGDGMLHIGVAGETVNSKPYAGAVVTLHFDAAGRLEYDEPRTSSTRTPLASPTRPSTRTPSVQRSAVPVVRVPGVASGAGDRTSRRIGKDRAAGADLG
jgi:hypothetical protein